MSAREHWLAGLRSRPVSGIAWLDRVRADAYERFAAQGWPTSRLEAWRHTSLAALETLGFDDPAPARIGAAGAAVARLRAETPGHWLVFVDGRHAPALSAVAALPGGAAVMPLSQALERRADEVEALFGDAAEGASPAALNAAFAVDGAFVSVPDGAAIDAPVHLVFVGGTAGAASQPRNLVAVGRGARLTVVEHYLGADDPAAGEPRPTLTNSVTRIHAGPDAVVEHLKLQQEPVHAIHLAAVSAVQARGARLDSHALSFGARLARTEIATRFAGEHCEAQLNGLYHVDGRRHVDHHTRIDHDHPRCTSREHYRGILDGAARGVFAGRIVVAPGAIRSDARQRTDSLLLSPLAEADARPELEIYADDVQCAHGATVGRLDDTALFYLRSRGIDEARARSLLVWAFAAQALERIALAPLRRVAQRAMLERLPGGLALEDVLETSQ